MTTSALSRVHLGKSVLLVLAAWLIAGGIIRTPGSYGATAFTITNAKWREDTSVFVVAGEGPVGATVVVLDTKTSVELGTATVSRRSKWALKIKNPSSVSCRVLAISGGKTRERDVDNSPSECDDVSEPATGSHAGRFSTYEDTKTCLACHTEEAEKAHDSVHYRWQGDSSESIGLVAGDAGKLGGINDFCIYPDINWIGKLTNTNGAKVDGGCAKCHVGLGAKPAADPTRDQLENIDCLICHIPVFAKAAATDMDRDWSQPGDLVAAKGLYEPHHAKGTDVIPEYKFFNGLSYFYQFGDPVLPEENGRVVMSAPEGKITDSGAKIHAFKHHLATQPVEPNNGRLLPLKIGKFFETGVIDEAVE